MLFTLLALLIFFQLVSAQTFTTIHHFSTLTGPFPGANSDGAGSESPVVVTNGVVYGNTFSGGQFGNGTLFRMNTRQCFHHPPPFHYHHKLKLY